MILNINLNYNNYIYHYELKKGKSEEKYAFYVYRTYFIKSEKKGIFSILKNFITEKKDINAEFFINKINKISKCELLPMHPFEQTAKKIVLATNLQENVIKNSTCPSRLSILYLNGKSIPKINNICIIDNSMYFIIKYKNEYAMYNATYENMKCIIPLSSVFKLYKKLKNTSEKSISDKFCLNDTHRLTKKDLDNLNQFTSHNIFKRPKFSIRNIEPVLSSQSPEATQPITEAHNTANEETINTCTPSVQPNRLIIEPLTFESVDSTSEPVDERRCYFT